ncbi:DUF1795 domain-containing protein [Serratia liquefaciens]|uniref:DUF1795 domain-containing protein n=1 Tax=Serratia liquefaciens TaxID=614 RepID=UPI00301BC587
MTDFSRCGFTGGSVALPGGYADRTVNVLLPGDDVSPSINISRDALQLAENLESYVTRQLDALAQGLKGWAFKSREPAILGDGLTAGEWVRASYLRDGKRIWQNQAVFAPAEGRVLVFTLTMARKLTPQDDALLLQVLSSYRAA